MFKTKTKADQLALKRGCALTRDAIVRCISDLGAKGLGCEYSGCVLDVDNMYMHGMMLCNTMEDQQMFLNTCRVIYTSREGHERSVVLRDAVERLLSDLQDMCGGLESGAGVLRIDSSGAISLEHYTTFVTESGNETEERRTYFPLNAALKEVQHA